MQVCCRGSFQNQSVCVNCPVAPGYFCIYNCLVWNWKYSKKVEEFTLIYSTVLVVNARAAATTGGYLTTIHHNFRTHPDTIPDSATNLLLRAACSDCRVPTLLELWRHAAQLCVGSWQSAVFRWAATPRFEEGLIKVQICKVRWKQNWGTMISCIQFRTGDISFSLKKVNWLCYLSNIAPVIKTVTVQQGKCDRYNCIPMKVCIANTCKSSVDTRSRVLCKCLRKRLNISHLLTGCKNKFRIGL